MKSEMRNKVLLRSTLARLGVSYEVKDDAFRLRGRGLEGVTVDVSTGEVVLLDGVDHRVVDSLRQHYAEAQFLAEAARHGIDVLSRTVDKDANIILKCRTQ
jgi:hypothetical protein